ncbi:YaiO family outer membrane beta-barrel protein [Zunongwangia sp. F363]|uniref:YaiO family outer membrane beta-barrel protein n=1 Tax=Autumnicola tepida TaxID=3075595 RepID=A0ABU3CBL1_9FLAO|nr:YaiO family outer membrane beta-barrel protein [Zunongwangia sp. F363]MDT0643733.1 YaiO family outer membrane beta-barrel protein [Zunongwangia sp. F363]
MKNFFYGILLAVTSLAGYSQHITETNTDSLYLKALDAYKNGQYQSSLDLTRRGLDLAPEYHDIRILEIRNYWALNNYAEADKNLEYLLKEAPEYIDTKPLALQRIGRFQDNQKAFQYLSRLDSLYPGDTSLKIQQAKLLLKMNRRKEAREIALKTIEASGISGANRYVLQTILNRTVSNEIGINYQFINFSKDYSRDKPWHTVSGEFQHNFNRTAVIGRVNYTDRAYDQGTLYELEAYPVFNDRMYAFTNIGFSDGTLFPDFRASASLFYNFAKIFEGEVGGRLLAFNDTNYLTGILGLTAYQGSFYLNIRIFLGPERMNKLVQNYQFNVRYYMRNADNYLFARLGSGISPDERAIFTQVQENPGLEAYYFNLGINKSIGIHHIFQLGGGYLFEDINAQAKGNQLVGFASYRYRF